MSRLIISLLLSLSLSACSNLTISSNYVTNKNLLGTKNFSFNENSYVNPGSPQYNVAILNDILQKSISNVLRVKNIQKAEKNAAEILVYYQLDIEKKSDWEKTLEKLGNDSYHIDGVSEKNSAVLVPGLDAPRSGNYAYGDLLIHVMDAANKELIWKGKAGLAIADIPEYSEIEQKFNKIFIKMFRRFP